MSRKFILVCIILLAGFLRFYQLGNNPPSLTWDEVAWGYNAYSLGIDGRDEFGRFLPTTYLESFGDFKPPVYAYLDIIPVKIFGLTEFAARFPSAFFGTLTVLVSYFLVLGIFSTWEKVNEESDSEVGRHVNITLPRKVPASHIALLTAFLLAISPWHIMLSRAAFEANVATFFLVSAVACFLYSLQKRRVFLILSAIFFVLPVYTFNSARILSPFLVMLLCLFFWRRLWQMKSIAIIAALFGMLLLAPTIPFLLSPQARLRYQEVNIFSDLSVIKTSNQEIDNDHNTWWSKLIHNRRLLFAGDFLVHYLDNLSPNFLFIKGDGNPKFSIQEVGQLYIWELPFFLIGLYFLFKNKQGNWALVPVWLLLGIIPAAIARETPHALRIEGSLPTFQVIIAYGISVSFILLSRYRRVFSAIALFVLVANFSYFIHNYTAHYPADYSAQWQFGYKDAIAYVRQVQDNYSHIVMTTQLGRPYIYYLFYLHILPTEFRKTAVIMRDSYGFVAVRQVGKYIFTDDTTPLRGQGKTLYIVSAGHQLPSTTKILKTFYLYQGGPVLYAYEI